MCWSHHELYRLYNFPCQERRTVRNVTSTVILRQNEKGRSIYETFLIDMNEIHELVVFWQNNTGRGKVVCGSIYIIELLKTHWAIPPLWVSLHVPIAPESYFLPIFLIADSCKFCFIKIQSIIFWVRPWANVIPHFVLEDFRSGLYSFGIATYPQRKKVINEWHSTIGCCSPVKSEKR